MEYFRVLLILIKVRHQKLIFSKVIMTDWYDMQVLKSQDVLSFLRRQAVWKNKGRKRKSLTGGTEVTAAYNIKALCHSHNVWGNEMNSLSGFLQFAVPKNTVLSAQMEHAWFWRRAWCKLQTSFFAYQWIPENQTFAVKWQVWKLYKNELIPVVLSDCMYCQCSGQEMGEHGTFCSHGYYFGERWWISSRCQYFSLFPSLRDSRVAREVQSLKLKMHQNFQKEKGEKKFCKLF